VTGSHFSDHSEDAKMTSGVLSNHTKLKWPRVKENWKAKSSLQSTTTTSSCLLLSLKLFQTARTQVERWSQSYLYYGITQQAQLSLTNYPTLVHSDIPYCAVKSCSLLNDCDLLAGFSDFNYPSPIWRSQWGDPLELSGSYLVWEN